MRITRHHVASMILCLCVSATAGRAQTPVGTAFTYQGKLANTGALVNGEYDLEFSLYDAATAGSQVGSAIVKDNVAVASGVFVVALDFGSGRSPVTRCGCRSESGRARARILSRRSRPARS